MTDSPPANAWLISLRPWDDCYELIVRMLNPVDETIDIISQDAARGITERLLHDGWVMDARFNLHESQKRSYITVWFKRPQEVQ